MGTDRDEIERIQRIRDGQIAARDPLTRQRRQQRLIAARYKPEEITLSGVVADIPTKWWGTIIGALVGFLLALIMDKVLHLKLVNVDGFWVEYLWYSLILFGLAMGRGLAAAVDWSDEDYNALVNRR